MAKERQPDTRPLGLWMGIGAIMGMLIATAVAYFLDRPYDKSIGTGACLGVALGALIGNIRGWRQHD